MEDQSFLQSENASRTMVNSDAPNSAQRPQALIRQAVNRGRSIIQRPIEIATSRPAIKAYLGTLIFLVTSIALLSISTTAYLFFYYNYIPQINLERTIYLQYDGSAHPYGTGFLQTNALVSQQPYDVSVVLHMPRTPINMDAGNFMIDLTLFKDIKGSDQSLPELTLPNGTVVHSLGHSRRPSILPYSSHITDLASTFMSLPFHLLSIRDTDSTTLTIRMFEEVQFARGKTNVPTYALLEIITQAPPGYVNGKTYGTPHLQIYSSKILFEARFHGLRYIIYNHRILSFCVFSSIFYMFSISSMAIAWALISAALSASNAETEKQRIKQDPQIKLEPGASTQLSSLKHEGDVHEKESLEAASSGSDQRAGLSMSNLSDTPTTFPTLGRNAPPLQYTPQTSSAATSSQDLPPPTDPAVAGAEPGAAADDEEEDEDEMEQYARMMAQIRRQDLARDSGIGTSLESEGNVRGRDATGLTRRRSGRSSGGKKEGE